MKLPKMKTKNISKNKEIKKDAPITFIGSDEYHLLRNIIKNIKRLVFEKHKIIDIEDKDGLIKYLNKYKEVEKMIKKYENKYDI